MAQNDPLHEANSPNKKEPGIHKDNSFLDNIFKKKFHFSFIYFLIIFALLVSINTYFSRQLNPKVSIEYNVFKDKIAAGEIKRVEISEKQYTGYTLDSNDLKEVTADPQLLQNSNLLTYTTYRIEDSSFIPLLDETNTEYYAAPPAEPSILSTLFSWILPLAFFLIIWRFAFSKMGQSGQGVMQFGQNKSKIVAEGDTGVRFKDVAGADESKQELEEVVDFLKNPGRYNDIGGRIPKGLLLVGPPGTGKTLLARAVAGEAEVPFFKMSGADFVEMFVGVGAARVRDLFRQAREKSPCIIFIDEIDAIGKSRVAGLGGNDEREQTLNQLLVEMDGFNASAGVIILGATNRPEILDPALLRPGRFDRQVLIDKPDLDGREAILKIHTKKIKLTPSIDLRKVAQATAGLSGADLANIANEAAILAVRSGRKTVHQEDFSEAIEKSIAGLQRKSRILNESERRRVAYHETGHALTAFYSEGASPVSKISIIPRGMAALGYTLQLPTEDRFLMSQEELLKSIDVLLGGRAAEELIFQEISTGAGNDISRASDLVRRMITEYGMSEKFRNITLPTGQSQNMLGAGLGGQREYSEATQQYIDSETARIVNERYQQVLQKLTENRKTLECITARLLEKEVLDGADFEKLASDPCSNLDAETEKPAVAEPTATETAAAASPEKPGKTITE